MKQMFPLSFCQMGLRRQIFVEEREKNQIESLKKQVTESKGTYFSFSRYQKRRQSYINNSIFKRKHVVLNSINALAHIVHEKRSTGSSNLMEVKDTQST
jgi:hypothetical protein